MRPHARTEAPGPIVSVDGARKSFAQAEGLNVLAIEDLSFDVAEGEYVAIVGPTGAGKSVLFDCLTGLKSLDRGTITIGGQPADAYRNARKGRITRIFQEDRLLPWLSATDNAAFGLQIQGMPEKERREQAAEWLNAVGLSAFRNAYPRELSGGMRQRVNIARAFAPKPDIVLLDEAFSALDEITAARLREDFKAVAQAQKMTFMIVTHSIDEAIYLGHRILVFGAPARLMAEIPVPDGAWQDPAEVDAIRKTVRGWIHAGARVQ
jgi:ABC-type nitrate/sulfonate/bicarbonate transport system ATPase subunit